MTQTDQILQHLRRHGSITPLEALNQYGIFRAAARVDELRDAGQRIETVMESRNGKRYARYVYLSEPEQRGLFA